MTCGSVVKLMNQNHKIRLHRLGIDGSLLMSQTYTLCQWLDLKNPLCIMKPIDWFEYYSHDVKYGSGSGQQSVTGTTQQEDVNSHWLLKVTSIACAWRSELAILKIMKPYSGSRIWWPLQKRGTSGLWSENSIGTSHNQQVGLVITALPFKQYPPLISPRPENRLFLYCLKLRWKSCN